MCTLCVCYEILLCVCLQILLCVCYEILYFHTRVVSGHDSMIGTVACYKLDGLGFKAQWGPNYRDAFSAAQMPTQLPVQTVMGYFSGGKVAGPYH